MYCFIKFCDKTCFDKTNVDETNKTSDNVSDRSLKSARSRKSQTSYKEKEVKKMETKENSVLMVNPECYAQVLIDYLYDEMRLDTNIKFDLCAENGNMLNIDQLKPNEYANTILEHKKTYIVVAYEKNDLNSYSRLDPLIYKTNKQESELILKVLKNLSSNKRSLHKTKSISPTTSLSRNYSKPVRKKRSSSHSKRSIKSSCI